MSDRASGRRPLAKVYLDGLVRCVHYLAILSLLTSMDSLYLMGAFLSILGIRDDFNNKGKLGRVGMHDLV